MVFNRVLLVISYLTLTACLGSDQLDVSSQQGDFNQRGLRVGRVTDANGLQATKGALTGIVFELNYETPVDVTFKVKTSSTTATVEEDYRPIDTTVTIPKGSRSQTLPFITPFNYRPGTGKSVKIQISEVNGAPLLQDQLQIDLLEAPAESMVVSNIKDFVLYGDSTCVIKENGRTKCWGAPPIPGSISQHSPAHGFWSYEMQLPLPSDPQLLRLEGQSFCGLYGSDFTCMGDNTGSKLATSWIVINHYNMIYLGFINASLYFPLSVPFYINLYNSPPPVYYLSDFIPEPRTAERNPGLAGVVDLAITQSEACFVHADGIVGCRSFATFDSASKRFGEVPRSDVSNVAKIVRLSDFNLPTYCTLNRSGQVHCWGSNSFQELGQPPPGPGASSTTALAVTLPGPAIDISANGNHVCVLLQAGGVLCWGRGYSLNGPTSIDQLPSNDPPVSLATSRDGACIGTTSGKIYCWGDNDQGQLGSAIPINGVSTSAVPLANWPASPGLKLKAGDSHYCAHSNQDLYCWGSNLKGQSSGLSSWAERATLVAAIEKVTVSNVVLNEDTSKSAQEPTFSQSAYGCALGMDGKPRCWGSLPPHLAPLTPEGTWHTAQPAVVLDAGTSAAPTFSDIQLADSFTCLSSGQNQVYCTGSVGTYSTEGFELFSANSGLKGLAASGSSAYGINPSTGRIMFAGRRLAVPINGTCQESVTSAKGFMEEPYISTPVTQISLGDNHACAVTQEGRALCWGLNTSGQNGTGSVTACGDEVPRPVNLPKALSAEPVLKVASGREHSCALTAKGSVACWGGNFYGQTGNRQISSAEPKPLRVQGLENVIDIHAGLYHTCALLSDGTVKCWGQNKFSQLGLAKFSDLEIEPQTVQNINGGAAKLMGGRLITCAASQPGGVFCWGPNYQNVIHHGLYIVDTPVKPQSY